MTRYSTLLLLPLILFAASLPAQDFEKVAPKLPPSGGDGHMGEAGELPPVDHQDTVELLPQLKGLVFVPQISQVAVNGRPGVHGVLVDGVELLNQEHWNQRLASRFGSPLTMAGLNEVLREVILFYRASGRPVVDVVVVEQDITAGVVQLAVIEGRLGEVRAEGARYFNSERMADQVRLTPGQPIYSTLLMADLAWLNRNPFRSVDLVYTPGAAEDHTDVVLRVQDRLPLRVYGGYEDSGNRLTGDNRWYTGVNYGNLWGLEHQINYQWTFNNQIDQLSAHSLSYVAPLPWRHIATIYGAHVDSEAYLPPPFGALTGETFQLSGRYTIPLPAPSRFGSRFHHDVEWGYDFKNSTGNLEFGLAQSFPTASDIHQFVFSYNASLKDSLGVTQAGVTGYWSPGGFGGGNNDADFQLSRAGAKADYSYLHFDVERTTILPHGFTSVVRGSAQWSEENLLPSEQLGFGGYSSVRGYEEREVNVDQGYLLSLELRAPAVSLLSRLPSRGAHATGGKDAVSPVIRDEFQALVFWDYAHGRNVNRLPGEPRHTSLSSVGPGFRWTINEHFSMRFDYGFQLKDSGQGLGLGDSRMHLGVTLSY